MKRLAMICLSLLPAVGMTAQNVDDNHLETSKDNKHFFNHLDISLTTGSTGIGLDVAMPVAEWMKLMAGFTYMPRFNLTMHFGVQIGDKPETEEEQQSKFDRLNGMLESFVGTKVDRQIDMIGEPCFDNVKLLADFYPFKNKKWHITAGFYYGGSKIAKAWNATEDATSLVAVAMYNNLYGRVVKSYESVLASMSDPNAVPEPFMSFGGNDYYADEELYNKVTYYGRMGVHIADYKDGTPYRLEPDENNMVKAQIRVNKFRPYLGFGYGGALSKKDDTYSLSFDCGMMFWGGTPKILTHDGTDLANDVDHVRGKVGDYVKIIKAFKVYPVLSLRLTRKIF